jgi:hypothetical protein
MPQNWLWPGIDLEKTQQQKDETKQKLSDMLEVINTHFYGDLEGSWLDQERIHNLLLLKIGPEPVIRFGYCECCTHYIGISAIQRKLFNIPVLNSYCREKPGVVKPEDRCSIFWPSRFYIQVILAHIERLLKGTPEHEWWMKRMEDDY